jgi:hypothetical protein
VASTSSGRTGAMGMLQVISQVMSQGSWLVGYSLQVLKGVVSAGCCARGAFCSWVLVLGVLVPGVLALSVTGTRSPGSPK